MHAAWLIESELLSGGARKCVADNPHGQHLEAKEGIHRLTTGSMASAQRKSTRPWPNSRSTPGSPMSVAHDILRVLVGLEEVEHRRAEIRRRLERSPTAPLRSTAPWRRRTSRHRYPGPPRCRAVAGRTGKAAAADAIAHSVLTLGFDGMLRNKSTGSAKSESQPMSLFAPHVSANRLTRDVLPMPGTPVTNTKAPRELPVCWMWSREPCNLARSSSRPAKIGGASRSSPMVSVWTSCFALGNASPLL